MYWLKQAPLKKMDLNNMHDVFYMIPSVYILKNELKLIGW